MLRSTREFLWMCAAIAAVPCSSRAQNVFAPGFESPGLSSGVSALAAFDPDGAGPAASVLFAGGDFAATAFAPASNIASWNGATWSNVGTGTNGWVGALETFDADGAGPESTALYLAGAFTSAGGVAALHVARFDGTNFQTLGEGLDDWAQALAVFDDDGAGPHAPALYAGGMFEHSGLVSVMNVARWNGTAFEPLGAGLDGPVTSLAVFNGALYAGGFFATAGSVGASSIARWTGTEWQAVGSGFNGPVHALTVFDPDGIGAQPAVLLAGGTFKLAGSVAANGIAQWNGSAWSALGTGIAAPNAYASIRALKTVPDGLTQKLYAAGLFKSAGSVSAGSPIVPDVPGCGGLLIAARWDGSAWTMLGSGLESNTDDIGRALISFDDDHNGTPSLFVAGHFTTAGASSAAGIARWSGSSWTRLGTGQGLGGSVNALASYGSPAKVAAAGHFVAAGTTLANRVATWDGSGWTAIGSGVAGTILDGDVRALLPHDNGLIVAGAFTHANGVEANRIASWAGPGNDLVPIGSGTDGEVFALTTFQGHVVAGGAFAKAGGIDVSGVATWDSSAGWARLGDGVGGTVRSLLAFDDGTGTALYVGGDFFKAGGVPATSIARWDGSTWTALGDGLCCGNVYVLAAFDDGNGLALYAGGDFDRSGEEGRAGIARWNPATSTWTSLASGVEGGRPAAVFTLATWNGALIVGGEFETAGGSVAPNLARWDGNAWSAFGTGTNGNVRALLAFQGTSTALYAGGDFTVIDGRAASRVARTQ